MDKSISYKELLEKAKKCLSTKFYPITNYGYAIKHAKSVIKEQFLKFGKEDTKYNTLLGEIDQIDDARCAHIVFTFLLGVFIYDKAKAIKDTVDIKVRKLLEDARHDDFPFLWFLICLFHDLGYAEENKKENSKAELCWVCDKKLEKCAGVPQLYEDSYLRYFHYRKTEHNVTDHGIYAGLKMYEDLCRIQKEQKEHNPNEDVWRDELVPLYNLASWVVLAHNIWFTKDTKLETCALYKKYSLDELILETESGSIKNYPIKLSEYPVLFLFCLVDLIEPMKRIGNLECCGKIEIGIRNNKIIVESDMDCFCGEHYLQSIMSANDWLAKSQRDKKMVEILFN